MLFKRVHVHSSLLYTCSTGVFHLSKFYLGLDEKPPLLKQCSSYFNCRLPNNNNGLMPKYLLCWPGRQGSAKNISQQKGPQPKKFGNRCHREGPITEKDLDMAIIVLVRGTKSFHLSRECRGRRNDVEVGWRHGNI